MPCPRESTVANRPPRIDTVPVVVQHARMHAEIAATVAREHTPGLSSAACSHLEQTLGRSATVLELEVYAALLRLHGDGPTEQAPLQLALAPGFIAALAAGRGRESLAEAALAIVGAGARPLVTLLAVTGAATAEHEAAAAGAAAQRLGFAVQTAELGPDAAGMGLVVGFSTEPQAMQRPPADGDVLVYLGAQTEREGPAGAVSGATYPPSSKAAQEQLLDLLRTLAERPGLILGTRLLGKGGLAQAAVGWSLGARILLDAVPRHPVALPPREILLAESLPRALVVVAAARVDEVLATARAQAVTAAALGALTADGRLRVLSKSTGAAMARPICELPLVALAGEPPLSPPEHHVPPRLPVALSGGPEALLDHLRAQSAMPDAAALVLRQGPAPMVLVVRCLERAAVREETASAAQRALSAAVSQVHARGATPVAAAWLHGSAAMPARGGTPATELDSARAGFGLSAVAAHRTVVPADGVLVVAGLHPADAEVAVDWFPGPGCLIALLGFKDADLAQEHAVGQLCGELIRGGLCAAVQPLGRGGLLLALGRACALGAVGATTVLPPPPAAADPSASAASDAEALLGDATGGYLLAIPAHRQADARILASERGVPLWPLGRTGGSELVVRRSDGAEGSFTELLRVSVSALQVELGRR